jgi:hypothetical protein
MADYIPLEQEENTFDNYNLITGSEFGGGSGTVGDYYSGWGGSVAAPSESILGGKRRYLNPGNEYSYQFSSEAPATVNRSSGLRGSYGRALANRPTSPKPTLSYPVRDEAREDALVRKAAAPGLRALRSSVTRAMQSNDDNPNSRRMTIREALAGYGQGLENVMASASQVGANRYEKEYSDEVNRRNTEFSAAMQDYFKRFGY